MIDVVKVTYGVGIDVGTSGIRLLLLDTKGNILRRQLINYESLYEENCFIWDEEKRINLGNLTKTITNQLKLLSEDFPGIEIRSVGISSIGPSLVLLSNKGEPITHAFTYASESAQDYVKYLGEDFQERTGSLHSGALPYVQLLKIAEEGLLKEISKITTINDYLTWYLTGLPLKEVFSTIPNASYTGLYSLQQEDWDLQILGRLGLKKTHLPKLIPLGTAYPVGRILRLISIFEKTLIVAGTIDGIDAFWATGSINKDLIVGSASTTGALRRWRHTRKKEFKSRLIQCVQISKDSWVELIPFNNVGTSFNWLAQNFNQIYQNYLTKSLQLNIEKLEFEANKKIDNHKESYDDYLLKIPIFFPYIEGEPRGPNGRGKISGGFIFGEHTTIENLDLYISLILGISNMFRHNYEMLDPPREINEIRLTGLIARKSTLFLQMLATLMQKNVVIMRTEQSVAWATAMRALKDIDLIDDIPAIPTFTPVTPQRGKIKEVLELLYSKYMIVYNSPNAYNMVNSEKALTK